MSEKNRALALFTKEREEPAQPIKARMAEWNTLYPAWAYREAPKCGWDSNHAVKRYDSDERSRRNAQDAIPHLEALAALALSPHTVERLYRRVLKRE